MVKSYNYIGFFFFFLSFFTSCHNRGQLPSLGKVHIKKDGAGNFNLIRDGRPFHIKGAGGYEHLDLLETAGANTIRIWDTTRLGDILNQAKAHNLAVVVGLPMPESSVFSYYNNPDHTLKQLLAFKGLVNTYKNHPSILMWCVGNEVGFNFGLKYQSFYTQFNKIVEMIHMEDPDHPVTSSLKNLQNREIVNIKLRTDLDLLSFNLFGRLSFFKKDLETISWVWKGPYIITEWGIDGPWEGTAQTAWGAYIEPSSNDKARQYMTRYRKYIHQQDTRCLGSFIFYWGEKQETTHTWFSLLNSKGQANEVVAVATEIWSGKARSRQYPQIKQLLINDRQVSDGTIETAKESLSASLQMEEEYAEIDSIEWEIFHEDWHKPNNDYNKKKLKSIGRIKTDGKTRKITFNAPVKTGPYRLFASLHTGFGDVATANIPFYVIADK